MGALKIRSTHVGLRFNITFIWHKASSSTVFSRAYAIVDLFFLFWNFFEHIFEPINAPLSGLFWDTEKCRTED